MVIVVCDGRVILLFVDWQMYVTRRWSLLKTGISSVFRTTLLIRSYEKDSSMTRPLCSHRRLARGLPILAVQNNVNGSPSLNGPANPSDKTGSASSSVDTMGCPGGTAIRSTFINIQVQ